MIGPINRHTTFNAVAISVALELARVAVIAVNTDRKFFGCSYEDLSNVRVSKGRMVSRQIGRPSHCLIYWGFTC